MFKTNEYIKYLPLPDDRRIIAISDIHGQIGYLENLMKMLSPDPDRDIIFFLGDVTEKGPDSLSVVRYVMDLCEKFTVFPVMGNVENFSLWFHSCDEETLFKNYCYMMKHWKSCLFNEMCRECGLDIKTKEDVVAARSVVAGRFERELSFLKELPAVYISDKIIFVHGGLPTSDLSRLHEFEKYSFMKYDFYQQKSEINDRYVVCGHFPVTLYNSTISQSNPLVDNEKKIISIDGGCSLKFDGQLNAVIIDNLSDMNISHIAYDDFPEITAITQQNSCVDSFNICWFENKIEVLSADKDFSTVKSLSRGIVFDVPNDYIYSVGNETSVEDFTNYILPVEPGDKLKLVLKTSRGLIAKKNGVTGWYYGEYGN